MFQGYDARHLILWTVGAILVQVCDASRKYYYCKIIPKRGASVSTAKRICAAKIACRISGGCAFITKKRHQHLSQKAAETRSSVPPWPGTGKGRARPAALGMRVREGHVYGRVFAWISRKGLVTATLALADLEMASRITMNKVWLQRLSLVHDNAF